ncbi:redox-regulated ATPase YchF [bacterium]|nr:redox-regulated ATPase YchF [bacterium]
MKLGIIGLPMAGKYTLFEALTQISWLPEKRNENKMGTVEVPDDRVDRLSSMYRPKKTTYAKVNYFLPCTVMGSSRNTHEQRWADVRDSDAFIHVIRNFQPGLEGRDPLDDFHAIEEDMIFSDLMVAEKRMEKLELDKKKDRGYNPEEHILMHEIYSWLEKENPLRTHPELAIHPLLRGFAFLSGKPMLICFNNEDDNDGIPDIPEIHQNFNCLAVRGQLEHEISQMDRHDMEIFLKEYGIADTARSRVIQQSYEMLGLISYFTVGEDEVRAWTIRKQTPAVEAAGTIHSDIQKGFIRAETVAYDDLMKAGSYAEARKKGTVRLEGREYRVQDGDIMNFRFNV